MFQDDSPQPIELLSVQHRRAHAANAREENVYDIEQCTHIELLAPWVLLGTVPLCTQRVPSKFALDMTPSSECSAAISPSRKVGLVTAASDELCECCQHPPTTSHCGSHRCRPRTTWVSHGTRQVVSLAPSFHRQATTHACQLGLAARHSSARKPDGNSHRVGAQCLWRCTS